MQWERCPSHHYLASLVQLPVNTNPLVPFDSHYIGTGIVLSQSHSIHGGGSGERTSVPLNLSNAHLTV